MLPLATAAAALAAAAAAAGGACAQDTVNGTGVTSPVDNATTVSVPEDCCAFCASFPACAAWTFHTSWNGPCFDNGKKVGGNCNCYASRVANPHAAGGTVSGCAGGPCPAAPPPKTPPPDTPPPPPLPPAKPPLGYFPNIILFLQDDQDEFLGGWTPMKQANALVGEKGLKSTNWFIHTPVCCPSRAELLSGRYFHNVRNPTPSGGCMHVDEGKVNPVSFAKYLAQGANYTNAWFGKHMNSCPGKPPPGFDCPTCYWFANGGGRDGEPGGFLNATFNDYDGGVAVGATPYHTKAGTYQASTEGEFSGYTTCVIGNKSVEWVRKVANGPQPFFVAVASKGPHVPATPAPWYADAFSDMSSPRGGAYNASAEQLKDHHWLIAQQGPITDGEGAKIDALFRNRWRTLLSIDDTLAAMVGTVEDLKIADKTYIFITSDHGYNLGQHRLPSCKLNVYDHDIRIPMVIRGPGIKAGSTFSEPASNVDVGPTFLGLAGLDEYAALTMDGRSIAPMIIDAADPAVPAATRAHLAAQRRLAQKPWRNAHFVEYYSLGSVKRLGHLVDDPNSNTYRALRYISGGPVGSGNMLYSEFTAVKDWDFANYSFVEIFDLDKDPHQLNNLASSTSAAVTAQLHDALVKEWECTGASCM